MKLIEKAFDSLAARLIHAPLAGLSLPNAIDQEIDFEEDEVDQLRALAANPAGQLQPFISKRH